MATADANATRAFLRGDIDPGERVFQQLANNLRLYRLFIEKADGPKMPWACFNRTLPANFTP